MTDIHTTAIVSSKANIGDGVKIGPYAVIEDNVVIGERCDIGSNTLLADGAVLGSEVKIHHGAVIGTIPQDLKFAGEKSTAVVGNNTVVREYATINRGTAARGETTVGQNCVIMAYAHVGHDCIVGNEVLMGNSVALAGHVEIDDHAILSGLIPVHQFVRIGAHVMIGGGYRVPQDIVPFSLAAGYPLKVIGINSVGLRRRGFPRETLRQLRRAFKILFFSNLNTSQALETIRNEIEIISEVKMVLDFVERSKRGIVK